MQDTVASANLGNPHELSMREIAHRIVAITGSRSPLNGVYFGPVTLGIASRHFTHTRTARLAAANLPRLPV